MKNKTSKTTKTKLCLKEPTLTTGDNIILSKGKRVLSVLKVLFILECEFTDLIKYEDSFCISTRYHCYLNKVTGKLKAESEASSA